MADIGFCELLDGPRDLEEAIRTKDRLFVLFYASWCPFSQAFLPEYFDCAAPGVPGYVRILCDDTDEHVKKYKIEVYPTVLYFEKGKVSRRLDGRHLAGISRKALDQFIGACKAGK
ncbi:MAG: protein disulfide isomerase family protein [Candidatus Aminicenantales bacterium]